MSKANILPATCENNTVTAEGVTVTPVRILSVGKGQSSGLLVMHGEQCFYVTSSALDLKTTIEKVIAAITDINAALTQIGTTLTSIGAGMTGPTTAPPGTLPADVVTINSKVTALNTTKSQLSDLKEALK